MEIIKVNFDNPEKDVVHRIVDALAAGQVVAMPFDTSYGLAVDATNEDAVERLLLVKERDRGKPISVVVRDYAMLEDIAEIPNENLGRFLLKYLPGKITVVLGAKESTVHSGQSTVTNDPDVLARREAGIPISRSEHRDKFQISKQLLGKGGTIGIRIPNFRLTNAVAWEFQKPFTATSANLAGQEPSFSAEEVAEQFAGREFQPDLIVNGGRLRESEMSTVVDATVWPPLILRQGAITIEEAE